MTSVTGSLSKALLEISGEGASHLKVVRPSSVQQNSAKGSPKKEDDGVQRNPVYDALMARFRSFLGESPLKTSPVLYRGHTEGELLSRDKSLTNPGNIIFSSSLDVAKHYARTCRRGVLTAARLRYFNPLVIDADWNDYSDIPVPPQLADEFVGETAQIDYLAKFAKAAGYDALIVKNVSDQWGPGDQYVVFDEKQVTPQKLKEAVLRTDEAGRRIVWERGPYFIAVDNPESPGYLSLWFQGPKKIENVGKMWLVPARESDLKGYAAVQLVDVLPKHRGKGLGQELYRQALKLLGPRYKGLASERIHRKNHGQVPKIWKRLGGRETPTGDFVADKVTESVAELPSDPAIKFDGKLYRGTSADSHHKLYVKVIQALYKKPSYRDAWDFAEANYDKLRKHEVEDGFVTTTGRFVSRVEAWFLLPQDVRDEINTREWRKYMDVSDLDVLYAYERQPEPAQPLEDPNANLHYRGRTGD